MNEQPEPVKPDGSLNSPAEFNPCTESKVNPMPNFDEGNMDATESFTEVAPAIVITLHTCSTPEGQGPNTPNVDSVDVHDISGQNGHGGMMTSNSSGIETKANPDAVSITTPHSKAPPDLQPREETLYDSAKSQGEVLKQPSQDDEGSNFQLNTAGHRRQGNSQSGTDQVQGASLKEQIASDEGQSSDGPPAADHESSFRKDGQLTGQDDASAKPTDAWKSQGRPTEDRSFGCNGSLGNGERLPDEPTIEARNEVSREGVNNALLRSRWADHGPAPTPGTSCAQSMNTSPVTPRDSARPFRNGRTGYNPNFGNANGNSNGYANGGRQFSDRDEAARLRAQNSKLLEELEEAKEKNRTLHVTLRSEIIKEAQEASQEVIAEVFKKQLDLAKSRAKLQVKEIRLQEQSDKIRQLERFLSVGQAIVTSRYPETLIVDPTLSSRERRSVDSAYIGRELMRDEIAIEMNANYREAEARLDARAEALELREQKIKLLERSWKIYAEESLRKELRGYLEDEISTEIAGAEYKRGFEHGKQQGLAESAKLAYHEGVLEGYYMARRSTDAMMALKNGLLPFDSPEVSFLFDPTHPENPFNRGMEIGSRGFSGPSSRRSSHDYGSPQSIPVGPRYNGHGSFRNGPYMNEDIVVRSAVRHFPGSAHVDGFTGAAKPAVKPGLASLPTLPEPTVEPTLYQQLNGSPPTYNGQNILANGNSEMISDIPNGCLTEHIPENGKLGTVAKELTPPDSRNASDLDIPGTLQRNLERPVPVTNLIDL